MDRPGLESVPADALFASLDRWAAERMEAPALHFIRNLEGDQSHCTFGDVRALADAGAASLHAAGIRPRDRLLLDLHTDARFVAAILGAFHLGAWPASVAPLAHRRGEAAELDWRHHVEALRPAAVVSAGEVPDTGVPVLHPDALLEPAGAVPPRAAAEDMRYVQFSSGSTGAPKALVLGMPGIAFNLERMRELIPIHDDDHIVSWLPMYHDMGLFGTLLLALHTGCELTLMDPSLFTRSPLLWFTAIQQARGRITVGPPSAMKAAFELLRRRPPEGLDLSRCDRWICGSEQVTPELITAYREVIGPYGAPPEGLKPVYGMAEITLTATLPPIGRGQIVEVVDRARFEHEHVAERADAGAADDVSEPDATPTESTTATTLGWTGVGHILRGQQLRIVDDAGEDLPDGCVGRILLASPSLYLGEFDGDDFTPREGAWHDTGDLGYTRGEELFITGRRRELIIKNGRNYAPERIEELAGTVDGVGRSAAFGLFDPARQTERAVLVAEVHPRVLTDAGQRDALRLAVRTALVQAGYELDEVRLVPRGSLPRTTSGKIKRTACREAARAEAADA